MKDCPFKVGDEIEIQSGVRKWRHKILRIQTNRTERLWFLTTDQITIKKSDD